MPGAMVAADKLPKQAAALDIKVGRYLQAPNALKVGVCVPVELVGEEPLHRVATVLAWRQADGVDHNQVNEGPSRAQSEVGGSQAPGLWVPALMPK